MPLETIVVAMRKDPNGKLTLHCTRTHFERSLAAEKMSWPQYLKANGLTEYEVTPSAN